MQPTAEQVADAIDWLEGQLTTLNREARAANRPCGRERMLKFLDAVRVKEAPPKSVEPDAWPAIRWIVGRLTDEGAVNVSQMPDGSIRFVQTAVLFRGLGGVAPADDDFGSLLE